MPLVPFHVCASGPDMTVLFWSVHKISSVNDIGFQARVYYNGKLKCV